MSEKSTIPSIGELSGIPFHVTCVCDGAVPRIDTVAIVPRPYDFIKVLAFCMRMSPIESDMLSCRAVVSSLECWSPMSRIRRRPRTSILSIFTFSSESRGSDRCPANALAGRSRSSAAAIVCMNRRAIYSTCLKQNAPGLMPVRNRASSTPEAE